MNSLSWLLTAVSRAARLPDATVKVLLDEQVPVQFVEPLRRVLRGHDVSHVDSVGWKGKPDTRLLPDAKTDGFRAVVTNDRGQLADPVESKAIKKSGLHHITFTMGDGLDGLALAMAAVIAAMGPILTELDRSAGQRLVKITGLARTHRRFEITDPSVNPPPYWPGGRRT